MNFLERRAIRRASRVFGLDSTESILEFDVGKTALAVLPAPLPFPVPSGARRIDLICTVDGLYADAGGRVGRWPWDVWLELRGDEDRFGRWIKGTTKTGDALAVLLAAGNRSFVERACRQLTEWEKSLSVDARAQRRSLLEGIRSVEQREQRRDERLREFRYRFASSPGGPAIEPRALGVVVGTDGRRLESGPVGFTRDALVAQDRLGRRVVAVIPYEAVGEPSVIDSPSGGSRVLLPVTGDEIKRLELQIDDLDTWLEWLAVYRGIEDA